MCCQRVDWNQANPLVSPETIGLYTGEILGVEACWGYWGDNLCDGNYGLEHVPETFFQDEEGNYKPTPISEEERAAIRAAAEWFEAHAETHEVWT